MSPGPLGQDQESIYIYWSSGVLLNLAMSVSAFGLAR
jgi:hypothetical protein